MSEEMGFHVIWADDLLGREADANLLYTFILNRMKERKLAGRSGSYVMNVDAEWGQGKSFFMERFYQQVVALNHPAVFINAWRDDFSDDPFTSVLSEFSIYIDEFVNKDANSKSQIAKTFETVKKNAGKIMWIGAKGVAGKLVERAIGDAKEELAALLSESEPLISDVADAGSKAFVDAATHVIDEFADKQIEEFNGAKKSIINFEKNLGDIIAMLDQDGKEMPFFIFVDELDRCRPTYAILMLERIKHLFDIDNVVFLIATDTNQLSEAIKAVYGQGFGSRKYLGRFFNRPYVLPAPDRYNLVGAILTRYNFDLSRLFLPFGLSDKVDVIVTMSEHYDLDIRQLEHAIDVLASIATTWSEPVPIDLLTIFPLIVGVLEKQSLSTHEQKMAMFTRSNKVGQYLVFPIRLAKLGNSLTIAAWAANYFSNTNGKSLLDSVRNISDQLNNSSDSMLMELFRQLELEYSLRRKDKSSLITQYVEIIQSMRSFTAPEDRH
jgi:hypothetical protein